MEQVKRLVLDVLKPHHPNPLDFAKSIAALGDGYHVRLIVDEIDEKTESIVLEITAEQIDFEQIAAQIHDMGGSVHSIDEVEVLNIKAVDA